MPCTLACTLARQLCTCRTRPSALPTMTDTFRGQEQEQEQEQENEQEQEQEPEQEQEQDCLCRRLRDIICDNSGIQSTRAEVLLTAGDMEDCSLARGMDIQKFI